MNEKLLNKEMYFNMLDLKFKQLMEQKNCFREEILESKYNDFFSDIFADNLKLIIDLNDNYSGQYYINEKIAVKIMNHVESIDMLMRDTRRYLCINKGTSNYFDRLEKYRKERK